MVCAVWRWRQMLFEVARSHWMRSVYLLTDVSVLIDLSDVSVLIDLSARGTLHAAKMVALERRVLSGAPGVDLKR